MRRLVLTLLLVVVVGVPASARAHSNRGHRMRWNGGPLPGAAGCVRITRESLPMQFSFSSAGCTAEIRRYAGGRFSDRVFADVSFSFEVRSD